MLLGAPAHAAGRTACVAGADLSSLESVEHAGGRFHDGRREGDAMTLLARRGLRLVRLRLWHTPARDEGSLASVTRLSRRARALGLDVLLDLHYSDTWADPGQQAPPRAWQGLAAAPLADSVRTWTRDVLVALRAADAAPAAVQLGNEIGGGLLWPEGRIFAERPPRWEAAATLLRAARAGVDEAGTPRPRVLLHHAQGGDAAAIATFADSIRAHGVAFDAVALSFYPWWHGSLTRLDTTCTALVARGLDAWIVETASPWAPAGLDATHDVIPSPPASPDGFAATPDGQRDFVRALAAHARAAGNVRAIVWWEPADVSAPRRGSAWENAALFDARGTLVPAGRELGRWNLAPR